MASGKRSSWLACPVHYPGKVAVMNAHVTMDAPITRLSTQGQLSMPATIRRELGAGPGTAFTWEMRGNEVVLRRHGGMTFEEIRKASFPDGPPPRQSLKQLKEGILRAVREKHARR